MSPDDPENKSITEKSYTVLIKLKKQGAILDSFIEKLDSVLKALTNELNALDFDSSNLESYKVTIFQCQDGTKSIEVQLTPVEVPVVK